MASYYVVGTGTTGNDFAGTEFMDGVFTLSTLTLTRTGAFPAATCKVGAKIYLTDNGSGNVTAAYYTVMSRTSDNAVVLNATIMSGATEPTDVKCVQHTGTKALPWKTPQFALNAPFTQADGGDQINVQATTTQTLTATLTSTAPTYSKPITIRGYTTNENDLGQATISGGGTYAIAGSINYLYWRDLHLTNVGANHILTLGQYTSIIDCELSGSTGATNAGVYANSGTSIQNCYFHNIAGYGVYCYAGGCSITDNYFKNVTAEADFATAIYINTYGTGPTIERNIISIDGASNGIFADNLDTYISHNSVLGPSGTGIGINAYKSQGNITKNNLVEGFNGVAGICMAAYGWVAHPMFSNNAVYTEAPGTAYTATSTTYPMHRQDNETLAESPFAKSGADTLANRFLYFAPKDVDNVIDGAFPNGCGRAKGAVAGAVAVVAPNDYDLRDGVTVGAVTGVLVVPAIGEVKVGVTYDEVGGALEKVGTNNAGYDFTAEEKLQLFYRLGIDGTTPDPLPTATIHLGTIAADWTDTEKAYIRYRLGIDGGTATQPPTTAKALLGTPTVNVTEALGVALAETGPIDANITQVESDATPVDGKTLAEALRIIAAAVAGKTADAGSGTESFYGLDNATVRFIAGISAGTGTAKNRTTVTYP